MNMHQLAKYKNSHLLGLELGQGLGSKSHLESNKKPMKIDKKKSTKKVKRS